MPKVFQRRVEDYGLIQQSVDMPNGGPESFGMTTTAVSSSGIKKRFVKNPNSGKRLARSNPESRLGLAGHTRASYYFRRPVGTRQKEGLQRSVILQVSKKYWKLAFRRNGDRSTCCRDWCVAAVVVETSPALAEIISPVALRAVSEAAKIATASGETI